MISKTRSTPVDSPASRVTPDQATGPVSNGSTVAADPHVAPAQAIICGTSSFRLDKLAAYLSRLETRPALRKALE